MIDSRASAPLDCTQNNRSVLWRIGQEYAEPLRAPITRETAIGGSSSWDEYELVASRRGPRAALAAATERFPYLLWYTNGKTDRARVRGSMWITRVPCGLSRAVFRKASASRNFRRKGQTAGRERDSGGFQARSVPSDTRDRGHGNLARTSRESIRVDGTGRVVRPQAAVCRRARGSRHREPRPPA